MITVKMALLRVYGCFIFVIIISVFSSVFGNVPVLLWESSSSDKVTNFPALSRISCERFNQYMLKKVHSKQSSSIIVLFVEESLSIEDFSWQDSQRQGYFPNIRNITGTASNVEFLPSVETPVDCIKNLVKYGYKIQYLQGQDFPEDGNIILIVKLQDANADEDRPDLLRRHDLTVAEVYSQLLAKFPHVIAVFTGLQTSWVQPEELNRVKRDVDECGNSTNFVLYCLKDMALLFSHNATLFDGDSVFDLTKVEHDVQPDERHTNEGYSTIAMIVKYIKDSGTKVFLNFTFDNRTAGYWTLRYVKFTNNKTVLTTRPEISAPHGRSYHSSSPVVYKNGDVTLTFSDLQCEAFFSRIGMERTTASPVKFSEAEESVPFFTPAIWCGITVTVLLGLILTWGITMVMDIKTMDQFDDPKGKTITINAAE